MKKSSYFTAISMIRQRLYKEYKNEIYYEKYRNCINCFLLEVLKKFLIDNGLFEMLVYNINCYGKYKIEYDINSISDFLTINKLSIFEIESTFNWRDTQQGFNFWKEFSDKMENSFLEKTSQQITVIK